MNSVMYVLGLSFLQQDTRLQMLYDIFVLIALQFFLALHRYKCAIFLASLLIVRVLLLCISLATQS